MMNALIVAYFFPPSVDAGSKRAEGFFRSLPEHGYTPIILTVEGGRYCTVGNEAGREPKVIRVRETGLLARAWRPHSGAQSASTLAASPGPMRRLVTRLFREVAYVPDAYRAFYRPALAAALDILRREEVSVGLCMSSPYTSLRLGHELALRSGLPWVADLRDLWVRNHFGYPFSRLRKAIDSILERRWLASANHITTATMGLRDELVADGYDPHLIDCIYSGFVEEPPAENEAATDPERLVLTFTGKLYESRGHSVAPLCAALAALRARDAAAFARVSVDFFGFVNSDFGVQLERFGLRRAVRFHGTVSREAATRRQWEADVLLLLLPDTPALRVSVPTKTFEYMAARKPLLAIVPRDGEAARILRHAGVGEVFGPGDCDRIADYLVRLLKLKKAFGRIPPQGDPDRIADFNCRRLAGQLARVLDKVAQERKYRNGL